ncbi:MAG: phosphoglucosamine mutase [bacterium]|nr:phosphoglucosamine mutase [bacterium]MDE0669226.1 phosphoglucosamine mutase [bacterium]MXZ31648.1 phosphoglucosamine mutase [Acidimicrobiia bacterium]MYB24860.1 phosphoglucosamine mutase [Acidimicrobiia bacterium]
MFGTDGIRGRAYREVTPETAARIGAAVVETFGCERVVVGHDPRASADDLLAGLLRGLAGTEAELLGVAPTPAVAFCCAADGVPGVVVSASHNLYLDNGLKIFGPGGRKLSDAEQEALAAALRSDAEPAGLPVRSDRGAAAVRDIRGRLEGYLDAVAATVEPGALDGLRLVVDGANGSTSALAPALLRGLGAAVRTVACEPNGRNINDGCGAASPEFIAGETRPGEIGLAFDGDGDRVVAYDGGVIDGDRVLALCGIDRRGRGRLAGNTVVVTVMSNFGLHEALAAAGIDVVTVPVGDRHVLSALEEGGWELGGEQSGHVVFRDLATTGDGLLTAVQLLDVAGRRGERLGDLAASAMTRWPQVLRNVVVRGDAADVLAAVAPAVESAQESLGDSGRVLVRASGTEPLIRVMVEAAAEAEAEAVAASLAAEVGRRSG